MGRRRWYRLQRGEDEARTGLTVRRKQEAVFYLRCQSLLLLSPQVVSNSITTLWPVAHQASLSLGFPRQEYWSGLLHKPMCPALAGGFFTSEPPRTLKEALSHSKFKNNRIRKCVHRIPF